MQLFIKGKKFSVIKGSLSALSLQEPRTSLFNITDLQNQATRPSLCQGCVSLLCQCCSHTQGLKSTAQGTLERGKPSTTLQKRGLTIMCYCQRLECSPTAAELGTSHLYLGCCNATLSPTRPHPQRDASSAIPGTDREQAPASPSTAVSQVSVLGWCESVWQGLMAKLFITSSYLRD